AVMLLWFFAWGTVCAIVAAHKGRSAIGWFCLGALFSPVALVLLLCLPKPNAYDEVLRVVALQEAYRAELQRGNTLTPGEFLRAMAYATPPRPPRRGSMQSRFTEMAIIAVIVGLLILAGEQGERAIIDSMTGAMTDPAKEDPARPGDGAIQR
ncbi:MAG: hypothetical protein JO366_06705, partial [Methylobacteriaceae bacterium]|nr:hypothetical protein [Methylobacteriaceae bacterium]